MSVRKWATELTPTVLIVGACFALPGSGVAVNILTGIAGNAAFSSTDPALGWLKGKINYGKNGAINHDLEKAMKQGYLRAISHLESEWKNAHQKDILDPDAEATAGLFRAMRDDIEQFLDVKRLKSLTENAEAIQSLEATTLELVGATRDSSDKNIELERLQEDTYFSSYVPEELHHKRRKSALTLDAFLKPYLHGHPEELQRFVRKNLINCIALYFGEELKSETKAWRAFQRLVTDSMIAGFARVEATQAKQHAEVLARLNAIAERLATEPVENVQSDGLAGLDNVIRECHEAVIAAVQSEGRKTRDAVQASEVALSDQANRHHEVEVGHLIEIKQKLEGPAENSTLSGSLRTPEALMPLAGRSRNQHFTGRADKLEELESAFLSAIPDEPMLVVLHGTGGVGKSQIALEYAIRTGRRYAGIWWVLAESQTTVTTRLDGLATYLDLPASKSGDQQLSAAAALRFLEEQNGEDRWLLVFDNVADVNLVSQHIPHRGSIDVIVTSQLSNWDGDRVFRPIPIADMSPEDARVFLTQRSGDSDESAADKLAEELGYLPLALEMAGAYVAMRRSRRSLSRYLQRYHDNPGEVIRRDKAKTGSYPNTLATTWSIALAAASEEVPESSDVMSLLAFMAPEAIPLDLIREYAHVFAEPLSSVFADPDHAHFEVLERYSLITVDKVGDVSVHRLIQAVTLDQIDDEERSNWITQTVRIELEMLPGDAGEFENWAIASRVIPHAIQILQHATASNNQEPESAVLMSHAASFLVSQGESAGARELFEQALALNQRVLPAEHPDIATSLNDLAYVLQAQGELTTARELVEEALAILEVSLPLNHPNTAIVRGNLSGLIMEIEHRTDADSP